MTHPLAGWSGEPGDVRDHRRPHPIPDERRRALLVVPADLADQDDQVRLGILVEALERLQEAEPVDRIAADPDAR